MYFLRLLAILAMVPIASSQAFAEVNPFNPASPPSSASESQGSQGANSGFSVRNPGTPDSNSGFNLPSSSSTPSVKEGFEPITESLDVVRIGEVNGMHIFRGTTSSTYLFESAKKHKLKRIPQNAFNSSLATPGVPPSFNPNSMGLGSSGFRGQSVKQMATGGMTLPPPPPSSNNPVSPVKR